MEHHLPQVLARSLTGLLLASCIATPPAMTVAPPTTAPSMAPGDIGLGRFVDVRDFSISFTSFSVDGQAKAALLTQALPEAWEAATAGHSRVHVVDDEADIRVIVVTAPGAASTGGGQLITMRLRGPGLSTGELAVLVHEIGHSLGCCFGESATPGGHWSTCVRGAEIMCDGGPGTTLRFSERELRALRLR